MNRLTVLLVVLALLMGMRVEMWRESYGTEKAQVKADHQTTVLNKRTQGADLHAATRIGAVAAGGAVLDHKNTSTRYVPTSIPGANTHATPASACVPVLLPSPWTSPAFRMQYDAGANPAGAAGQADTVPGRSP